MLGREIRLERLKNPASGRILTIAVDHAPSYGVLSGLQDIQKTVDQVAAAGPDAMVMMRGVAERCFRPQARLVANLSALVRQAERAGMPVIAHAYPNGDLVPRDEIYTVARVGYAARLAMELGVDIVKTFYTGSAEAFTRIVEMAAPAWVVAAGGPRLETDADVLQMASNVVRAGAAGITFGRNVWQSSNATGLIRALKQIVHKDGSVDSALRQLAE